MGRKKRDERHFDFCTACLLPWRSDVQEHHVYGRQQQPLDVVFLCGPCHALVEGPSRTFIADESQTLVEKKKLLLRSNALRFLVKHFDRVREGFRVGNRNGVGSMNGEPWGHFGALGFSGRRYYFVLPHAVDELVEVPTHPTPQEDGIGGCAVGSWVRFRGERDNVLGRLIDMHQRHRVEINCQRQLTDIRQTDVVAHVPRRSC